MSLQRFRKKVGVVLVGIVVSSLIAPVASQAAQIRRYVSNQTIVSEMMKRMSKVDSFRFEGKYMATVPQNSQYDFFGKQHGVLFYGSVGKDSDGKQVNTISIQVYNGQEDIYPHIDIFSQETDMYVRPSNLSWLASQMIPDYSWYSTSSTDVSASTTVTSSLERSGLSLVENQWVKITEQSIGNFFSGLGLFADDVSKLNDIRSKQDLSSEQLQAILKAAKKYNVLLPTRVADEVVDT
jgi:hypothetical protein